MKGLRKKLKDRSGASILLALLFFLLCSMVGASVLMAAVSNAGKSRSNREEQKKYLLLSSALRLVCDELTSAKYYGKYTYKQYYTKAQVQDEYGVPIPDVYIINIYHVYEQTPGEPGAFQCGGLEAVLPLQNDLDLFFASKFQPRPDYVSGLNTTHYTYYTPLAASTSSGTYKLTVDTSGVAGLDGSEYEPIVTVQMDQESLSIQVIATLGKKEADGTVSEEADGFSMEAWLTGQGMDTLELPEPVDDLNFAQFAGSDPPDPNSIPGNPREPGPVTWKLDWIAKKEAGK